MNEHTQSESTWPARCRATRAVVPVAGVDALPRPSTLEDLDTVLLPLDALA